MKYEMKRPHDDPIVGQLYWYQCEAGADYQLVRVHKINLGGALVVWQTINSKDLLVDDKIQDLPKQAFINYNDLYRPHGWSIIGAAKANPTITNTHNLSWTKIIPVPLIIPFGETMNAEEPFVPAAGDLVWANKKDRISRELFYVHDNDNEKIITVSPVGVDLNLIMRRFISQSQYTFEPATEYKVNPPSVMSIAKV